MLDFCVVFFVEVEQGWLDLVWFFVLLFDFLMCEIFCCGFGGFMWYVQDMLVMVGFDMVYYYQESFQFDVDFVLLLVSDVGLVSVVFIVLGVMVSVLWDQIVLEIVCVVGIDIEIFCVVGLCGICLMLKIVGNVEMCYKGGISQDEIDEGYILVCCVWFLGDFGIEV